MEKELTRRNFLKAGVAATLGMMSGTLGMTAPKVESLENSLRPICKPPIVGLFRAPRRRTIPPISSNVAHQLPNSLAEPINARCYIQPRRRVAWECPPGYLIGRRPQLAPWF